MSWKQRLSWQESNKAPQFAWTEFEPPNFCSLPELSEISLFQLAITSENFLLIAGACTWLPLMSCSLRAEMCWIPSVSKALKPMSKVSCLVRRVCTFYKFIISDMDFLVKIVVKQIGFVNISQLSKVVHLIFQLFTVLSNRISMIVSLSINYCPASQISVHLFRMHHAFLKRASTASSHFP